MVEKKKIKKSTAMLQESLDNFNKTPEQEAFMRKQLEESTKKLIKDRRFVDYKYNKYKSKYLNISK